MNSIQTSKTSLTRINVDTPGDHLANFNQLGHNKPCMDIINMDSIANMEVFIDVLRVRFECMRLNDAIDFEGSGARGHVDMECGHFSELNSRSDIEDMDIDDMNSTEDITDSTHELRADFGRMCLTEDMELGETDVSEYMDISNMDSIANTEDFINVIRARF